MSESIEMPAKNGYLLTSFVVTDVYKTVIYAAPLTGTTMAKLVQHSLPLKFDVGENVSSIVSPEVLSVSANASPQAYGYAGFGFNVVNANLSGKVKSIESYQDGSLLTITDFHYDNNAKLMYSISKWVYGGGSNLLDSVVYDYSRVDTIRLQAFGLNPSVPRKEQLVFDDGNMIQFRRTDTYDATNHQWDYQYGLDGHIKKIITTSLDRQGKIVAYPTSTVFEYETDNNGIITSYSSWAYTNGVPVRRWYLREVSLGNAIAEYSALLSQLPFRNLMLPNNNYPMVHGRSILYNQNNLPIDTCEFGYNYIASKGTRSLDVIEMNPTNCHIVYDEPDIGVVNKYIFW